MPSDLRSSDLRLLRLLQVFDSQFPVGAFAHSGGLETYASLGAGLSALRELLHAQIDMGWGRSELAAACLAWRLDQGQTRVRLGSDHHRHLWWSDPSLTPMAGLAREVDARKVVPAVRNSSIGLGRRTLELLQRLYPDAAVDVDPPHHAVVIGAAGRRLGIELRELLLAYGQSLAYGMVTAALRCMPISPPQAQELIAGAHERIVRAVDRAMEDPERALFACTPALDIRCHQHASLHTRLFQS